MRRFRLTIPVLRVELQDPDGQWHGPEGERVLHVEVDAETVDDACERAARRLENSSAVFRPTSLLVRG